jgi:hypothetical protein
MPGDNDAAAILPVRHRRSNPIRLCVRYQKPIFIFEHSQKAAGPPAGDIANNRQTPSMIRI